MAIILGIDPGSRITGYGIIQADKKQHRYIASGVIRVGEADTAEKLGKIFTELKHIIQSYQPEQVAVEQVFMHLNANAAIKLGQARGAAIVAAADYNLPVAEYSARQIKQSVVGYGAADKAQVQHMVKLLLQLSGIPAADAADALAVALCHANTQQSLVSMGGQAYAIRRGRLR
jgi:crossover junction endodeoxyribonuclease RuvC